MKRWVLRRLVWALLAILIFLQYNILTLHHHDEAPSLRKNGYSENKQQSLDEQVCSAFTHGITAASLWTSHKRSLLQALRDPRDVDGNHIGWTRDLLDLLTPSQMEQVIQSQPDSQRLQPLVEKLSRRLLHPETQPPLKVFVFGGSIVEGSGCERSPVAGGQLDYESLQECAWPHRLQVILDHVSRDILGIPPAAMPLVEVYNLAAGGTHSEAAVPILDYWLSPTFEPNGPDIVVNAYSANDNLPPAFYATTNTTVDNFHLFRVLDRNLQFIQAARHCSCPSPLVLYVDDYLGNQQESILGESQLDEAIQWLADHEASMGYLSIARVVRKWVFANTTESFFSGKWIDAKGRPTINVHFGMAGHVATSLAVTYGLLHLIVDYCEESKTYTWNQESQVTTTVEGLVEIELPSKLWVMEHQPKLIVPKVKQPMFPGNSGQGSVPGCLSPQSSLASKPCFFAFLAAPLGTHHRQESLADYLRPYVLNQYGWQVQNDFRHGGFQNKLGLVAFQPKATMALGLQHITSPIRVLTMHYLKSYGELWEDSRARFQVEVFQQGRQTHMDSFELEGFHKQTVSISYFHRLELSEEAPVGGAIRFTLDLTGGQAFKINALMFCSR